MRVILRPARGSAVVVTVMGALTTVYFAPLGDWMADHPLPFQGWMKTNPAVAAGLVVLLAILLFLLTRPIAPARELPGSEPRRWRNTEPSLRELRRQMREVWIDRVLARSLENLVPVELNFTGRGSALHHPLHLIEDLDDITLPRGIHLSHVFAESRTAGRLVILGAPGSGKSTEMLHLAEHLLDRSDRRAGDPVPVILPLSAGRWALEPGALDTSKLRGGDLAASEKASADAMLDAVDWMAREISRRYLVPKRDAYEWLIAARPPVVVLLDGLDEIQDDRARLRCVRTIAHLRAAFSFGMVVTCRSEDYDELGYKLNFGAAVEIQPLAYETVDAYLTAAGPELEPLRLVCVHDPQLAELFSNTLHLAIAVLTYRGRVPDRGLLEGTGSERLEHLWSQYVDLMLNRRRDPTGSSTGNPRFPPDRTYHWLTRMAAGMRRAGRMEFRLEHIDAKWLPEVHAFALRTVLGVLWLAATVAGLVYLTAGVAHRHSGGLAALFVVVIILALGFYLAARWGYGELAVGWDFAPENILTGLGYGTVGGIVLGIFIGLGAGPVGLLAGLIPGVLLGLIGGIAASAVPRLVVRREDENRSAARRTLRTQLIVLAGMASIPVLTYLVTGLFVSSEWAQRASILAIAPAIGATWGAASANLQPWLVHRAASLWALAFGLLPRRLGAFMVHADERIVMRRAAGGYEFLHLTLRDHLAAVDARTQGPADPQERTVPARRRRLA
ncbi:energy-coupling factor transporter ATP-binding protein EcfA2 [Actinoplanes tereljensis]|uniref:NACHT domain-containing protein n=1 Tax=Paractinoplanes tereljensis TaxID=571912 RepID=A0A919NWJ7_9ACTN|nr:hypothetical protein [Actinoplanes tereljensis]GIF25560.1 hypothetical protein Ate02nite_82900 [Actinoplanes tereljensis]